ncbi:hypothetical protein T05_6948, partial [Trichinella murrelli]
MKIVLELDGQLLDIYFNGNGAEVDNSLGLTLQLCSLPLLHFLVPRVGMKIDFPKLRLVTSLRWYVSCLKAGHTGVTLLRRTKSERANWSGPGGSEPDDPAQRDKKGCGGAIWTNLDVTSVIKRNDHIESCPVDEHLAYKMEKRAVLTKRSAEETKPIPAIYDEEASAEPSTSGCFPPFIWVKSAMYGHRAKRFPKLPNHRQDLQIPVPFRTTKADDDFLLWQSASRHILVFATGYNIRLAAMRSWGMDGTFKIVPHWYEQLFTIHAFVAGKLVPAVCLCTDKDIVTYGFKSQALISRAAALEVDLNPETIICDFETALIPAIRGYFPNTRVQGCYFHFCQA